MVLNFAQDDRHWEHQLQASYGIDPKNKYKVSAAKKLRVTQLVERVKSSSKQDCDDSVIDLKKTFLPKF